MSIFVNQKEYILQHQACCRRRTQQGTFQEVGEFGDMGISYIVQQNCLSLVCFLGQGQGNFGDCHSWHHQENSKDTKQGNSKSRSNKKRIFQKQIIMAQMNLTPLDDVLDKHFGKVGTPKRDAFESDVDEALHAYRLGEAIKKARIEQNLTQEQLGERIGVKRAQISRLERGYSITIPTMRRVFKALGVVTATIDLGIAGKVALW